MRSTPRAARLEHPHVPQAVLLGLDLYLWLTYPHLRPSGMFLKAFPDE